MISHAPSCTSFNEKEPFSKKIHKKWKESISQLNKNEEKDENIEIQNISKTVFLNSPE